jgi:hypothetical protein
MATQPVQSCKPTIDARQACDLLTSSNSGNNEGLSSASRAVASFGKVASLIPGVGTAVGAACSLISGILSFLANPCS